jgi:hypothetical protein
MLVDSSVNNKRDIYYGCVINGPLSLSASYAWATESREQICQDILHTLVKPELIYNFGWETPREEPGQMSEL